MVSFSISCGGISTKPNLKLPPVLIVPTVSLKDVKCLTKEVKVRIKKRDKLKSARITTLENIIKSTH